MEIKGDDGPSGLTAEEKGKTKIVNIITVDEAKEEEEADVMPATKRTVNERETRSAPPGQNI